MLEEFKKDFQGIPSMIEIYFILFFGLSDLIVVHSFFHLVSSSFEDSASNTYIWQHHIIYFKIIIIWQRTMHLIILLIIFFYIKAISKVFWKIIWRSTSTVFNAQVSRFDKIWLVNHCHCSLRGYEATCDLRN